MADQMQQPDVPDPSDELSSSAASDISWGFILSNCEYYMMIITAGTFEMLHLLHS